MGVKGPILSGEFGSLDITLTYANNYQQTTRQLVNSSTCQLMKSILTIILLFFSVVVAHAQVKLGVKGGYNVVDMKVSKQVLNAENRNGFFVGPTLKWEIAAFGLGLDLSALYDEREFEVEGDEMMKFKQKMVTIPLNLRMTFGSRTSLGVFVYGGPQVGYNLNDDEKVIDQARTWKYKDSSFSVNLGGGVLLFNTFQVSANYNVVCGRTADVTWISARDAVVDDIEKHRARSNAWQLSAAIYF